MMYVISGKYTSFLSVQYILYSQTLVYIILICCPTSTLYLFIYKMSYTEVHSRLFVLFIFKLFLN